MPWISKKSKLAMRARRKKKEKFSNITGTGTGTGTTGTGNSKGSASGEKRKRDDDTDHNHIHDDDDKETNINDLNNISTAASNYSSSYSSGSGSNWESIQKERVVTVTIPSTLPTKEAKKIRKEARRKARKEGRNEDLIKFVNEHGHEYEHEHEQHGYGHANDLCTISNATCTSVSADNHDSHNNNNENLNNQRRKRQKSSSFPNINQLLADAAIRQKQKEQEEAKQAYENSIPSNVKDQYVALDCEMVGIGEHGKQSALARVSITNWYGDIVLDTFVQVPDRVTDFRTFVSGVKPKDIKSTNDQAMELHACRMKVGSIIKDKILVGHSLKNDFSALMLGHPKHLIRDTARYKPFMRASGKNGGKLRPRKLRDLVKEHVGLIIQKDGEAHTSVEDARATMELYKTVRQKWEKDIMLKSTTGTRTGTGTGTTSTNGKKR